MYDFQKHMIFNIVKIKATPLPRERTKGGERTRMKERQEACKELGLLIWILHSHNRTGPLSGGNAGPKVN